MPALSLVPKPLQRHLSSLSPACTPWYRVSLTPRVWDSHFHFQNGIFMANPGFHLLSAAQTLDRLVLATQLLLCTAPRAQQAALGAEPHRNAPPHELRTLTASFQTFLVGFCVVLPPSFPKSFPHSPWIFHNQHLPAHQACEHSREISPCSSLISYPWLEF